MTAIVNAFAKALLVNLLPTAARTATGQGAAINLLDYEGVVAVLLDSAAGGGTTPTLDVSFEESDDGSTNWTAVPAAAINEGTNFTQVVAAASQQIRHFNVSERKQYLREAHVIAGTTPTFTYSLNLVGQKKYS